MPKPHVPRTRLTDYPSAAWVIFAGMFVNKFGNFLPVFLVLYLIDEGYSAGEAGLALSIAGLGGFAGNIIGGTVADRFGRRTAIVLSQFGAGVFTAAVPLVHGLWPTTVLVAVIGVFAQLYRPGAGALLIDVVPQQQRVGAFAVLRLAINLGMAVGPMVGGLLSGQSWTYIFVGDALSCVVFGLLSLFLLPGGRPVPAAADGPAADDVSTAGDDATTKKAKPERQGYLRVFTDTPFLFFLFSMVCATFVYAQGNATLPLHVSEQGFSNSFYGLLLGVNAVVCILFELPLTRWTERWNPRFAIMVGLLLLAVGMSATGLADNKSLLVVTVVLWSLGEIVYTPISSAYPSAFSPAHLRGRYQGAEGLAHTAGQAIGPAVGGYVFAWSASAHWWMCAAVAVLGALIVLPAIPGDRDTGDAPSEGEEAARLVEDGTQDSLPTGGRPTIPLPESGQ
ncbi:MDR family MFS transporter [Streptomyces botrytidirepellens]|uniref:MFS transporter n=1 Tax=Streptomyces botrytidirepellens TaxID=2486417 RepID=A0A3M8SW17_9ACTN|nr:MFS transporter [Streptomyces botrytidirepellens]RNF83424.1 MFS transporter [Streptomyces botrytidirepellens]